MHKKILFNNFKKIILIVNHNYKVKIMLTNVIKRDYLHKKILNKSYIKLVKIQQYFNKIKKIIKLINILNIRINF